MKKVKTKWLEESQAQTFNLLKALNYSNKKYADLLFSMADSQNAYDVLNAKIIFNSFNKEEKLAFFKTLDNSESTEKSFYYLISDLNPFIQLEVKGLRKRKDGLRDIRLDKDLINLLLDAFEKRALQLDYKGKAYTDRQHEFMLGAVCVIDTLTKTSVSCVHPHIWLSILSGDKIQKIET
jgi:hypothetical protein